MSKSYSSNNAELVDDLLAFIERSPTPFHATANLMEMFTRDGYERLSEANNWNCQAGGKYVVSRNDSSLIAFSLTDDLDTGLTMLGAHTDSPCLRIKPNPEIEKHGYLQLGVEVYGGALLHPWMDRDLSIAGRVSGCDKDGNLIDQLINFKKAVGTIPNLAIHLDREANKNKTINAQTHLPIVVGQQKGIDFKQLLLQYCDDSMDRVLSYELSCYDMQAPSKLGLEDEFICAARLDNLLSSYIAARALLDNTGSGNQLYISTDHEEVGSASACGAQGPFLKSVLQRLTNGAEHMTQVIGKSMLLSCDNAHGIHPNYSDKHDQNHGPILNQGPVIKSNANQRYATTSVGSARFQQACEQADIPLQHFVVRSDMGCGSTIGPITATELGVETLDLGAPQWAMHSIRETCGTADISHLHAALCAFLN